MLVRRDGPLARFGHNHVLVAPVHGVIHAGDTSAQSGFSLQVAVNEFVVDPPAAREEEGDEFLAEVTDAARLATRGNLLGDAVLDAARFPAIALESVSMLGPRWNPSVTARLTLHGIARDVTFPAAVVERDGELIVVASFRVNQSAFGIEPFSILGGGLSVQDQLRIRARIVAARE